MEKTLRVLILEDSEDDLELLLRALRKGGYAPLYECVETAEDMEKALDKGSWEVILSDYLMPRFDAPTALKRLKEKGLDIPFIIVSGAIGEETAVTAMKMGAHDYVMKDNLTRLVPVIEREIREAEERRKRKQAEKEKAHIEAQLLQAQKMEALGRLTGGIAHDFNNLLTAIHGCAHLAATEVDPASKVYSDLMEIQTAAERAMNLTRQLLLFSRRQPMKMAPVELNGLIQTLLGILHRIIGEDIQIALHLAEEPLWIDADTTSIEQVIMNLAVNARDAMSDGGLLTIKTEKIQAEAVPLPVPNEGPFARLTVIDTGSGMDEETLKHIFEPFFSTKEVGKGSGLGLSVVYGIIQQHKGWIQVKSRIGEGTTFEVCIPLTEKRPEKSGKKNLCYEAYRGHGERILLIEDEPNIRRFTEKALSQCGYTVFTATDKDDALMLFEREDGRFDLVFSDVVLPSTSGLHLIESFLKKNPGLQVLLSSGYIDQKSQRDLIQQKAIPFLQKPYALGTLFKTIHALLHQGQAPSELDQ